jgi:uncharacterized protein (TIGR02217 family)
MTYPVFPTLPGQAIGITRAPLWRTGVQSALSGKEVRLAYMSYPLYQWALDLAALRSYAGSTEYAQMIGFINNVQGMAGNFLFQDPEDNAVVAQQFGVGNGATSVYQLVRAYGSYSEPVQQPAGQAGNPGSINVYINGTLWPPGTGWNFGTAPGTIAFTANVTSGAIITWSGPFYFLCRLLTDTQVFTQEFINAWSTQAVTFQSVKL